MQAWMLIRLAPLCLVAAHASDGHMVGASHHIEAHEYLNVENVQANVDSSGAVSMMRKHTELPTPRLVDPVDFMAGSEEGGGGDQARIDELTEQRGADFDPDDFRDRRLSFDALFALAHQRQALSREIVALNKTGELSEKMFSRRKSQVRGIEAKMLIHRRNLKLNDEVKRLTGEEWVQKIIRSLEKAEGPHGAEWRACQQMVHSVTSAPDLTTDYENFLKKLVPKCKEKKSSNVHPNPIDCEMLDRQMMLQKKLLGPGPLRTPKGFCAILVDAALPIEDEPPCMRFMEDISHEFEGDANGVVTPWPAIIGQGDRFDNAFHEACALEQHALPGGKSCAQRLSAVKKVNYEKKKYKKLPNLLADLCPAMGMPLSRSHMQLKEHHMSLITSRSQLRNAFRKAALIAHDEEFVMDEQTSRSWGESACCDRRAYTVESGVSFSAIITIGLSNSVGFGFQRESGGNCHHSQGSFSSGSVGLSIGAEIPDPDIGYSIGAGFMYDFDDIAGHSFTQGWEFCFFFCVAGGTIHSAPDGRHIGEYVEISLSVGAMPDLGVARQVGYTYTAGPGGKRDYTYSFSSCPSSGGCFPGSALLQTPSGKKQMADLRAGDKVLAVNEYGEAVFDDVYFFGHADSAVRQMYTELQLPSTSIRLTARHFIMKCPDHGKTCAWEDRVHAYAEGIVAGDYVWVADLSRAAVLEQVLVVSQQMDQGMFNPYTLSGNIVVNGAVASSHSDWILDNILPASYSKYLPSIYQALFLPGRVLYMVAGATAATVLDVNNPQQDGDSHGKGPHFLTLCFVMSAIGLWMIPKSPRK